MWAHRALLLQRCGHCASQPLLRSHLYNVLPRNDHPLEREHAVQWPGAHLWKCACLEPLRKAYGPQPLQIDFILLDRFVCGTELSRRAARLRARSAAGLRSWSDRRPTLGRKLQPSLPAKCLKQDVLNQGRADSCGALPCAKLIAGSLANFPLATLQCQVAGSIQFKMIHVVQLPWREGPPHEA